MGRKLFKKHSLSETLSDWRIPTLRTDKEITETINKFRGVLAEAQVSLKEIEVSLTRNPLTPNLETRKTCMPPHRRGP